MARAQHAAAQVAAHGQQRVHVGMAHMDDRGGVAAAQGDPFARVIQRCHAVHDEPDLCPQAVLLHVQLADLANQQRRVFGHAEHFDFDPLADLDPVAQRRIQGKAGLKAKGFFGPDLKNIGHFARLGAFGQAAHPHHPARFRDLDAGGCRAGPEGGGACPF